MANETGHGGLRVGQGRKPRSDEIKLIESLDLYIEPDKAFKILEGLVADGNFNALKLYFEYRYGKPKETKEINITAEQPFFRDAIEE